MGGGGGGGGFRVDVKIRKFTKKNSGGGGCSGWGVRMDENEEMKFCENSKKIYIFFFFGGGGGGGGDGGFRVDVN